MEIARGIAKKRSWVYAKTILISIGLCFFSWVALAEMRLLPASLTREVEAYFEWESTGFRTFRLESRNSNSVVATRVWDYLVAIQIKPRLEKYLKQSGWKRIEGRVEVKVAMIVPVALPTALGSGGDVIYDPEETPLMQAADKGDVETVRHILAAGVDVNARDQREQTALIHACLRGNATSNLIKALLSAGAEVNARDRNGRTPLLLAVQTPISSGGRALRSEIVAELLAAHPDVNAQDEKGDTALMMAAAYAGAETVRALLLAGADRNAYNKRGETALSIAEAKGDTEILQLLRRPL